MHEDARVARTKKKLKDALVALMGRKPLAEISVSELCEEAAVNRNTFYSHYRSPQDLFDVLVAELSERTVHALAVTRQKGSVAWLTELCIHVQKERDLYALLLANPDGRAYIEQEIGSAYRLVMDETSDRIKKDPDNALIFAFATGGSIAIIEYWISEGATRPLEEIAKLINSLCTCGTSGRFQ